MNPFPTVEYDDRAVWVPEAETLVLADLHLGRVRQSNVEFPIGETPDLLERLTRLGDRYEPTQVVIAGDLVHAFDTVPYGVAESLRELVDAVTAIGAELSVTSGNHDGPLAHFAVIDPVESHRLDSATVIHHGHERPTKQADRYIIGHEHPAVTMEGQRRPCFLECWDQLAGAAVLVLPAFSRVALGTPVNDMTAADSMSPLLTDLDSCRPVVRTADDTLSFPPLDTLRSHL
ncbi:MAG: metallophosphoesterase [Halodesulfurarchaeum sp.]